jgi:uncharacterized membrane protein YkoI
MNIVTRTRIAATLALLLVGAAGTGAATAACLDNRQIQEAVASGEIMSLAAVLASAGVEADSDILSVEVCDEGGRLVYIIGVLTPSGEARTLQLSAQ